MTEVLNDFDTDVDADEAVAALRDVLAARLAQVPDAGQLSMPQYRDLVEREIGDALTGYARQLVRAGRGVLTAATTDRVRQMLLDIFTGSAGLQRLIDDPQIETINVNGHDNVWVLRRDGSKMRVGPVAASETELQNLVREEGVAASRRGGHERRFDRAEPELSVQLANGGRMHALMDVTEQTCISIRLFPPHTDTLPDLMAKGELTAPMVSFLHALVQARRNIVVVGGPAAGKTTLLNALADAIPVHRRIIVVEDTRELRIDKQRHPDLVRIQTRLANTENAGGFDMSRALRSTLRMSPDVVIVGEVRGAEVVWMAKAMSIGIDGSMCTLHASDSAQALLRLVAYALEPPERYPREAAVALLASAVHFIVHIDFTPDGTRVVSSIREITGSDGDQIISNEIFRPGPDKRAVPYSQLSADSINRLTAVGFDVNLLDTDGW